MTKSKIGHCYHCDRPVYPPERYSDSRNKLPIYPLCDDCKGIFRKQAERKAEAGT